MLLTTEQKIQLFYRYLKNKGIYHTWKREMRINLTKSDKDGHIRFVSNQMRHIFNDDNATLGQAFATIITTTLYWIATVDGEHFWSQLYFILTYLSDKEMKDKLKEKYNINIKNL